MMPRLAGKVALITGAARGQGEAAARLFVAEGARVLVTDVIDDQAAAVAADLGPNALSLHLDISSEDDWQRAVREIEDGWGRLDVLVNNAAILEFASLLETTTEQFLRITRVNQLGVLLGMRECANLMARSGGGSIVNVSSVDGLRGLNGVFSYATSKWAVRGMSKCAAMELGPLGIRVNSVHPGGIDSPMNDDHKDDFDLDAIFGVLPVPRLGTPEEIAKLVLFLASDESSYCTAAEFVADGGWTAGHREPALPGY